MLSFHETNTWDRRSMDPSKPCGVWWITCAATRLAIALLLGSLFWCNSSVNAQSSSDQEVFLNLRHTMLVRKVFLQDKELAPLNLGVKVENRIAYLWGAVPTSKILNKAILTVRNQPDILEVRSNLYIDDWQELGPMYLPDPEMSPVHPPVQNLPSISSPIPSPQNKAAPGAPTSAQWQKPATNAPDIGPWHKPETPAATVWQKPAPPKPNISFKPIVIETPSPSEDQGLFVLPTIAIPVQPGASSHAAPKPQTKLSLAESIQQIKKLDNRLQFIQVTVDGNRVYLNGYAAQWAEIHQLAKAIAQLPGVENVVIGQVQIGTGK